jgi:hypothetical protein
MDEIVHCVRLRVAARKNLRWPDTSTLLSKRPAVHYCYFDDLFGLPTFRRVTSKRQPTSNGKLHQQNSIGFRQVRRSRSTAPMPIAMPRAENDVSPFCVPASQITETFCVGSLPQVGQLRQIEIGATARDSTSATSSIVTWEPQSGQIVCLPRSESGAFAVRPQRQSTVIAINEQTTTRPPLMQTIELQPTVAPRLAAGNNYVASGLITSANEQIAL